MTTIAIEGRFRGPPGCGNGGYVSGLLGRRLGSCAEATLRRRTPLDTPLKLAAAGGGMELRQGDVLIAEARAAALEVGPVPQVSFAAAEAAAAQPLSDPATNAFAQCFVCGCGRPRGDGLRLFPGPLDRDRPRGEWTFATPWIPAPGLAGADGRVDPVFVWAALDCPAGMALAAAQLADPGEPPVFLLGRQAVRIDALPWPGQRCIVATWPAGQEGRRHYAEGALLSEEGGTLAVTRSTWIEVDRRSVFG